MLPRQGDLVRREAARRPAADSAHVMPVLTMPKLPKLTCASAYVIDNSTPECNSTGGHHRGIGGQYKPPLLLITRSLLIPLFCTVSFEKLPGKTFVAILLKRKCQFGGRLASGKRYLPDLLYGIDSRTFHIFHTNGV